jgi:hypothetical protein
MARAILLTFKDNAAAEAFVKAMWRAQSGEEGISLEQVGEIGLIAAASSRIQWMVARPLQYCKCKIVPHTGQGKFATKFEKWRQTERYGWHVHVKCNKPSYWVVRDWIKHRKVGLNDLLPELREEVDGHRESEGEHSGDNDTGATPTDESALVQVGSASGVPAGVDALEAAGALSPDGDSLP